jgi:F-type H+-transporting ATPase subunit alpha
MFTRFGGLSDARVKAQIDRGERIRALLTQPRFAALRLVDQVALLVALADGVFDSPPVEVVQEVRQRVVAYLDANASQCVSAITKTGTLDDATRTSLVTAVRNLASQLAIGLKQKAGAP